MHAADTIWIDDGGGLQECTIGGQDIADCSRPGSWKQQHRLHVGRSTLAGREVDVGRHHGSTTAQRCGREEGCSDSARRRELCSLIKGAFVDKNDASCPTLTRRFRHQSSPPGRNERNPACSFRRRLRQVRVLDHLAVGLAILLMCQSASVRGDRASDALFVDGGQEPFNFTYPPSPGFIYVSPRKSSRGLTPWFEFQESFSVQLWLRPKRVFVGTEVEGGIVGCLVRNTFGTEKAGYGLTLTSDSTLHFTAVIDVLTATLDFELEVEEWVHITVQYDHLQVRTSMWASKGDGEAPNLVAQYQYQYEGPKSVNYYIHNDLLIGYFQPMYDPAFFYSGYLDELRFWSRTMDLAEMTDSIYRAYLPNSDYLLGIGMVAYYPMNSVKCTDDLCGNVVGMQQWIHVGRNSRFTSSLVLYSSPLDRSDEVLGLDCRYSETAEEPSCICHEFTSNYCWDEEAKKPVYCNTCTENNNPALLDYQNEQRKYENCIEVACYGPYGSPKCLQPVLQNGTSVLTDVKYEIEISTCIDGNNMQKWTKGAPSTYYPIINAENNFMCLSVQKKGPYRGTPVFLEACAFETDPDNGAMNRVASYQSWQVDSKSLSLKNELAGFCVSASLVENGDMPYLIDCITVDSLDTETSVKNFLFDWVASRSGIMIGGAYLTTDTTKDKCDGSQLCFPDVKAPIEQKPRITHVNAVPLTQYQMQMEAFADTPFELTITARDPNLNDHIQIDFTPFDVVLQTHESVEWPMAFLCDGGPFDQQNCTCDDYACFGGRGDDYDPLPIETPGGVCPYGTCRKNPFNSCPSNPCTRKFIWTPIPFTEFINPATLVFIARDIPVNEQPGPAAAPQQDVALQIVTTVRMPPSFEPPTPTYKCKGGLYDGQEYRSLVGCKAQCETAAGRCNPTRYQVAIGDKVCFKVRAISLEPEATINILFLTEGTNYLSPPESRVVTSELLPTIKLVEQNGVLVETKVMNPVERTWCFAPNSVDARRTYQACFVAYNPTRGLVPSSATPVYCVEVEVLATNPLFENPSPLNGTIIDGYVGCKILFHMAALKNDSASYVLEVFPTDSYFYSFNGTRNERPKGVAGLPHGSVWQNLEATDATQVFTFTWTPEEGQEGLWQVCFKTQDSLAVSMELRCISLNVVRCRRCIRKGDQLETLSKLYNTHWLELFLVNPAVHSNPADLRPGMLINVGVLYRSTRLQPLPILAKYLHTTPSAIRRLNPDIGADDEMIGAYKNLCVMPETCGESCGDAAHCDRLSAIV